MSGRGMGTHRSCNHRGSIMCKASQESWTEGALCPGRGVRAKTGRAGAGELEGRWAFLLEEQTEQKGTARF